MVVSVVAVDGAQEDVYIVIGGAGGVGVGGGGTPISHSLSGVAHPLLKASIRAVPAASVA